MAKARHVLAIDQGTTGTHVTIVNDRLKVVGQSYQEFHQYFPKPGWVEHDLREIWASVEACVAKALRSARLRPNQIEAIGITNQRETVGLWTRDSGKPVHRAIVWQDRRTADVCAQLRQRGEDERFRSATGLVIDPYFSATKLAWLLENIPGARVKSEGGELCAGTIDTWLVFKLTNGKAHVTDVSNASRTLVMNIHRLEWDSDLLEVFGLPKSLLPKIRGSSEQYGVTQACRSLPDGIPIVGIAGDQQAALFGQACYAPGETKCTYGTGAFLLMNTGATPVASRSGLLTTVAWGIGGTTTYALEGSAFIAGAAVQWLRDQLGLIKTSAEVESLAKTVRNSGNVVFVPALSGLGAPHWRPEARGLFCGIDRSTNSGHLARAVLEGIALQINDLAEAMRSDSGRHIPSFRVDGGAAANNLLMQYQADILGTTVIRPKNVQTTSLGAAFLAGLGAGIWKDLDDLRFASKVERSFTPKLSPIERERHLTKWRTAVARA